MSEGGSHHDLPSAPPREVAHLKSYRVGLSGEVVVMEYQAEDGGQVELSMAAIMWRPPSAT